MKKFISTVLLFTLFFGLSGCTQKTVTPNIKVDKPTIKVVQTNVIELKQVESKKDMENRYAYNKKNYQLLGVFKNTIENDLILENIIANMKKIVNDKEKTFRHTNMKYSFDEQRNVCRNKVNLGQYGYFRNVVEKEKLLIYCFDDIEGEGQDRYYGTTYSPELKNGTLLINITVGNDKVFLKTWQKVRTIKFDKKIYLMIFSSDKSYREDMMFINTNLLNLIHDKKIATIKPPHNVDFIKFSKLL